MLKISFEISTTDSGAQTYRAEIHRPVRASGGPGVTHFICRVDVEGLPTLSPMEGETPLQALRNAAEFVETFAIGKATSLSGGLVWTD